MAVGFAALVIFKKAVRSLPVVGGVAKPLLGAHLLAHSAHCACTQCKVCHPGACVPCTQHRLGWHARRAGGGACCHCWINTQCTVGDLHCRPTQPCHCLVSCVALCASVQGCSLHPSLAPCLASLVCTSRTEGTSTMCAASCSAGAAGASSSRAEACCPLRG